MKSFNSQREKTPEIGKYFSPKSTPENVHGLSQKIQGTYFKISALYFKIYGLYFLQHALCFFEHAKRDVATPFYEHEFAFQTIHNPFNTE